MEKPINSLALPKDFATSVAEIKSRIREAQYQALKSVNKELITLYWDIGCMIWGKSVIEGLSN
jgi:hypothetical protein